MSLAASLLTQLSSCKSRIFTIWPFRKAITKLRLVIVKLRRSIYTHFILITNTSKGYLIIKDLQCELRTRKHQERKNVLRELGFFNVWIWSWQCLLVCMYLTCSFQTQKERQSPNFTVWLLPLPMLTEKRKSTEQNKIHGKCSQEPEWHDKVRKYFLRMSKSHLSWWKASALSEPKRTPFLGKMVSRGRGEDTVFECGIH